jgi:hypothetical protein
VRPGHIFTTVAGMVRVEEVTVVDPGAITEEEARRAGHPDADRLRARLAPDAGLATYRVRLSWAGEDPRIALREDDADPGADRRRPRVRAPDVAAQVGRERDPFKIDVRKLKRLGLTRSHEVGYELSPRGLAYLARTERRA